jgi:hypothetical protein
MTKAHMTAMAATVAMKMIWRRRRTVRCGGAHGRVFSFGPRPRRWRRAGWSTRRGSRRRRPGSHTGRSPCWPSGVSVPRPLPFVQGVTVLEVDSERRAGRLVVKRQGHCSVQTRRPRPAGLSDSSAPASVIALRKEAAPGLRPPCSRSKATRPRPSDGEPRTATQREGHDHPEEVSRASQNAARAAPGRVLRQVLGAPFGDRTTRLSRSTIALAASGR